MSGTCQDTILRDAVFDRARIYLAIFRELSGRFGEETAVSVMRAASRAHGIEVGQSLRKYAPKDFDGLYKTFFEDPDEGTTYSPRIYVKDANCLDVQMMTCPLKEGWVAFGCSDEEVCTLLRCATAFDEAVWETAGFELKLEMWSPGKQGCCRTRLHPKPVR